MVHSLTAWLILLPPAAAGAVWLEEDRWLQQGNCTDSCCASDFPCAPEEAGPFSAVPFAVQILLIVLLISFSALFSGLTLGLMGLDQTGLEIVMASDDPVNAACAKRIYPVRKKGNQLLCTLLLGNVSVNALLSILMADKAGGLVGFFISTMVIVIFGEIVPQAFCNRYALRIGSATVPLVKVILVLFCPIAWPMAWVLDQALGQELATTYNGAEMSKMLQIHVQENMLDKETALTMTGALKYKDTKCQDAMTPLTKTFMLSADERLSFETIIKIFHAGYSRIPVYEIDKSNVIGLLFTKDLIFIDPENETRVKDFVEIFGRELNAVWVDDKLGEVLRLLKQGRSHMALVRDVRNEPDRDPFYALEGIITLEGR
jgi:metal transporter CNNM